MQLAKVSDSAPLSDGRVAMLLFGQVRVVGAELDGGRHRPGADSVHLWDTMTGRLSGGELGRR